MSIKYDWNSFHKNIIWLNAFYLLPRFSHPMQFQLKELKNGLIPNENRSSRKWKSKRKIKFISGQFLLVLSKNDDALTKFLSKNVGSFLQLQFTLWKLQNFTATIFLQKFRQINVLLKKFTTSKLIWRKKIAWQWISRFSTFPFIFRQINVQYLHYFFFSKPLIWGKICVKTLAWHGQ